MNPLKGSWRLLESLDHTLRTTLLEKNALFSNFGEALGKKNYNLEVVVLNL